MSARSRNRKKEQAERDAEREPFLEVSFEHRIRGAAVLLTFTPKAGTVDIAWEKGTEVTPAHVRELAPFVVRFVIAVETLTGMELAIPGVPNDGPELTIEEAAAKAELALSIPGGNG